MWQTKNEEDMSSEKNLPKQSWQGKYKPTRIHHNRMSNYVYSEDVCEGTYRENQGCKRTID